MTDKSTSLQTSIQPWLTVQNAAKSIEFYKNAFGAVETYRMEDPGGGLVVKLSIDGAEFWISSENDNANAKQLGNDTIRMILVVDDPDTVFTKAIAAGASEIFPVGEEYGWRLGRIVDPFGLHWEIGHLLTHDTTIS
jgi:PhnB protein